MTNRPELSFDGKGINGPDQYRTRIATFAQTASDADVKRYGNLFAASPVMLAALELAEDRLAVMVESDTDENRPEDAATITTLRATRAAIKAAKEGTP